jgi:hypothetical protein
MLLLPGAALAVSAPAPAPEPILVMMARQKVEKVKGLVASGILPRVQLVQAERSYENAKDDEYLRKTLYAQDLTPAKAEEMMVMTERRITEHQKEVEETRKMVDSGILPANELQTVQDALARAQKEHEWAQTRAHLVQELYDMAQSEQSLMRAASAGLPLPAFTGLVQHFVGNNVFTVLDRVHVETAFETEFHHPLPVSADGESMVHRSLGFDHRGRVDVALLPDSREGLWLRDYLTQHRIPFFAFRAAISHQATGAHIHIGPPSTKLEVAKYSRPSHSYPAGE